MEQETKLITSSEFIEKVGIKLIATAIAIVGEDETGHTPEYIDKRNVLGVSVLNDLDTNNLMKFVRACACQSGLSSVITVAANGSLTYTGSGTLMGDIEFTIISVFGKIAGLKQHET